MVIMLDYIKSMREQWNFENWQENQLIIMFLSSSAPFCLRSTFCFNDDRFPSGWVRCHFMCSVEWTHSHAHHPSTLKTKRLHHYLLVYVYFRNVKCVLLPWNFIVRFLSISSDFRYLIWREHGRDSQYTKTMHAMEFASLNRSPLRHTTQKFTAGVKAVCICYYWSEWSFFGNV